MAGYPDGGYDPGWKLDSWLVIFDGYTTRLIGTTLDRLGPYSHFGALKELESSLAPVIYRTHGSVTLRRDETRRVQIFTRFTQKASHDTMVNDHIHPSIEIYCHIIATTVRVGLYLTSFVLPFHFVSFFHSFPGNYCQARTYAICTTCKPEPRHASLLNQHVSIQVLTQTQTSSNYLQAAALHASTPTRATHRSAGPLPQDSHPSQGLQHANHSRSRSDHPAKP